MLRWSDCEDDQPSCSSRTFPARLMNHCIMILVILSLLLSLLLCTVPVRLLYVASGSMEPAMPTGSVIAVRTRPGYFLEPGQVITYERDSILITHRVIETGHDGSFYYITKGDANLAEDAEPVRHQQIVGTVVFISPRSLVPLLRQLRSSALHLSP
jgi:signal peptidase I